MRVTLAKLLLDQRYQALSFRCAFVFYALILVMGSISGAREDIRTLTSARPAPRFNHKLNRPTLILILPESLPEMMYRRFYETIVNCSNGIHFGLS